MSVPIAVLASGRGSNFEAIAGAIRARKLDARIVAVLSDRSGAEVLAKARAAGIQTLEVPVPAKAQGAAESPESLAARRKLHGDRMLEVLAPLEPRFLVLAGFMRVLSPEFIDAYRDPRGYSRIVNVHPSLLPAFPGVGSYAQAFAHGAHLAGVTVHLVEHDIDSGPICSQEAFSIADCRSAEEVETRGLAVEHRLYPRTLSWVLPERFEIEKRGGRPCVRPN